MDSVEGPRQAIVLAAGLGQRLQPITETTPKALLPICNVPLIEYALAHLVRAGVRRVAVNVHHGAALIVSHLRELCSLRYPELELHISHEPVLLGTGGALAKLKSWLDAGHFWVANADALHLVDLRIMAHEHARRGADATLMVTDDEAFADERRILLDSEGAVVGFSRRSTPEGRTFCGVHIASEGLLDHLTVEHCSVVWSGYVPWLKTGGSIYSWAAPGFWEDVGTPERYLRAHRRLIRAPELLSLGLHDDNRS